MRIQRQEIFLDIMSNINFVNYQLFLEGIFIFFISGRLYYTKYILNSQKSSPFL